MKCKLSLLLLFAILSTSSCRSAQPPEMTTDDTAVPETTVAETVGEYDVSDIDYNAHEFNLLNVNDIYSMHSRLDREGTTGDKFDDAMYERCRTLENELNIKFIETLDEFTTVTNKIRNLILAGDDTFDAMYVPYSKDRELGTESVLLNLLDINGFQFDQPWWNTAVNELRMDDTLYGATGDAHLMQYDSTWLLYYNETMGSKLGLDAPYQLVRDGKWTFDTMQTYLTAAANLNGDSSFSFKKDGNATYGISMNVNGALYMLFGAKEQIFGIEDDSIIITAGSDRYYMVADRIADMMNNDGRVYRMTSDPGDDAAGSYVNMFETERALFAALELSKTNRMRDLDFSFGIVPFPKYDETQENYVSCNGMAMKFAIPVTAKDPEMSAIVGDALNYYSYKQVKNIFREVTLEQKNLRNEDSIEMLEITLDQVQPNLVYTFGLSTMGANLQNSLRDDIFNNKGQQSSILASKAALVEKEIDELYQ